MTQPDPTRRDLLAGAAGLAVITASGGLVGCADRAGPAATAHQETRPMPFTLKPLPYATNALEPAYSTENLELHHGKHLKTYVDNLNKFVEEGKADGSKSLEQLILTAGPGPVFNNAAQIWNHDFFFAGMKPGGGGAPGGALAAKLAADFGSFENFKKEFTATAVSQFGSGWGWLVVDGGKLKVTKTGNAELPLTAKQTALLTVDVWEHAYYPTYKNLRAKFVEAFLDKLVNWDFVAANLAAAK